METLREPLVKRGWQRAIIYLLGTSLIVFFFQLFGEFLISQLGADLESAENAVLNFALMYVIMSFCIFAFTLFMRRLIDRRSFESLGFTWKGYGNLAGLGFFTAIAMLGIGTLILVALNYIAIVSASFDPLGLIIGLAIMLVVAFIEELLFRGYLLNNLLASTNKWVALVITSVLFAAFHGANPDITVFALLNILLAGLLLGLNYIFTKNLWFSIFFHFAWNYFQGPILGYEVSGLKLTSLLQQSVSGPELWTGGQFGFEGSLLCPLLLVIAIIGFAYAFTRRYQQGTT